MCSIACLSTCNNVCVFLYVCHLWFVIVIVMIIFVPLCLFFIKMFVDLLACLFLSFLFFIRLIPWSNLFPYTLPTCSQLLFINIHLFCYFFFSFSSFLSLLSFVVRSCKQLHNNWTNSIGSMLCVYVYVCVLIVIIHCKLS